MRVSWVKDRNETNLGRVEDELAFVLEVHGDLSRNVGLDLSEPPIGTVRIAHEHAWLEKGVHVVHR